MRTQTFTYKQASVTVKRAVIRDRLAANMVISFLDVGSEPLARYAASEFAQCVSLTTQIEGDIGFVLPKVSDSPETLKAGFEAWLEADPKLLIEWQTAIALAGMDFNDPDLTPNTPDEKKRQSSGTRKARVSGK